ncbi:uncharacterized protein EDB91DRAFT_1249927 [Suillus paluster]|uniref:uncharacterized protein n=1 Tax=Suillus paluster TaxID=48578 RepID=UPI001B870712|nr:uncharacterized protein EDB91DRAFT_1249927 [Suillus paluster]KAG1736622.1 hypothetical protein EDB91DRAFT_1249927 [Suillus paluster]
MFMGKGIKYNTIINVLSLCKDITNLYIVSHNSDSILPDLTSMNHILDTLPLTALSLIIGSSLTRPSMVMVNTFTKLTYLEIENEGLHCHLDMGTFHQLVNHLLQLAMLKVLVFHARGHRSCARSLEYYGILDLCIIIRPSKVFAWDHFRQGSILLWELADERTNIPGPNHSKSLDRSPERIWIRNDSSNDSLEEEFTDDDKEEDSTDEVIDKNSPSDDAEDSFPPSHVSSFRANNLCIRGLTLEDMILAWHQSPWREECNHDPDVEKLLEHCSSSTPTEAWPSPTLGYIKIDRNKTSQTASSMIAPLARSRGSATTSTPLSTWAPPAHTHVPPGPQHYPIVTCIPSFLSTPATHCAAQHVELPPCMEQHTPCAMPAPALPTPTACRKAPAKVKRDARRHRLHKLNPDRKVEELKCNTMFDALTFHVSTTGWQGTNYSSTQAGRALREEWYSYGILFHLIKFDRVPYQK